MNPEPRIRPLTVAAGIAFLLSVGIVWFANEIRDADFEFAARDTQQALGVLSFVVAAVAFGFAVRSKDNIVAALVWAAFAVEFGWAVAVLSAF
jgi:hypothetical protein